MLNIMESKKIVNEYSDEKKETKIKDENDFEDAYDNMINTLSSIVVKHVMKNRKCGEIKDKLKKTSCKKKNLNVTISRLKSMKYKCNDIKKCNSVLNDRINYYKKQLTKS